VFKCDFHYAKIKYFRSQNGILSKVGSMTSIDFSFPLKTAFSTPVLLYGFEMVCLTKSQINSLNYPFNCIYTKLFTTFDQSIIAQRQYFKGPLPIKTFAAFWVFKLSQGTGESLGLSS